MNINKIILTLLFVVACADVYSPEIETKQNLREVGIDAGLPISTEFQAEYSTYIWNDSPMIYVPNFGLSFTTSNYTYFDINSPELNNLEEVTVEFWFNPNTDGPFVNYAGRVFSLTSTSDCAYGDKGFYFEWQIQDQQFRVGSCSTGTGGQFVFHKTDLIDASNYVVIQTKTNGFKVFLNGVLIKDLNLSWVPSDGGTFTIGATKNGGGQYYAGLLDNVAVYNRILSTDEIIKHYVIGSDLLNR